MGWTELSIGLFDCQTAHRPIQSGLVCLATIRYIFTLSPRSKFVHCWFPNALSPKSTLASRGSNCTPFFLEGPAGCPCSGRFSGLWAWNGRVDRFSRCGFSWVLLREIHVI